MKNCSPGMPTAIGLYEALELSAKNSKQRMGTLHRLRQACDAMVAAGKDFSLKDIERYCKSTFGKGPNAQSICNDKGLRAYVDARKHESDLCRQGKARSPLDRDVEEILDPDIRSRMRLLVEDYRLLQKQFRILTESLAKLNPPLDLDALFAGKKSASTSAAPASKASFNRDQLNALRRLVDLLCDPDRLRRIGLNVDAGDIVSRGLRETVVEERDIQLLQALFLNLNGDFA